MSFVLRKCTKCNTISDDVVRGLCSSCELKSTSSGLIETHSEDAHWIIEETNRQINEEKNAEVKPPVAGKPSISLIPREAIFEMARSFDYGTKKHGRYAFRDGVEFSKLIDAALRHLHAVADGEDIDLDSGEAKLLHAGNAMSNLAMLIFCMQQHPEKDDRWNK